MKKKMAVTEVFECRRTRQVVEITCVGYRSPKLRNSKEPVVDISHLCEWSDYFRGLLYEVDLTKIPADVDKIRFVVLLRKPPLQLRIKKQRKRVDEETKK